MAYRFDKDLEFLKNCTDSELNELVNILIYDPKDGEVRLTEEITMNPLYKSHRPNHSKYWQLIAAELQAFGANSIATLFRGGKGVLYYEILQDVCERLKVEFTKELPSKMLEWKILQKVTEFVISEMPEAERIKFLKETEFNTLDSGKIPVASMSTAAVAFLLSAPLAFIASGAWLATNISGPAYRVTIPAVIAVAKLRLLKDGGNLQKSTSNSE